MSEKKTIQINPDLFNYSNKNTTRKKQPKDGPTIKIKSEEKKSKQKSLRKNVLKMIREKQQEEYKRLFGKSNTKTAIEKPENKEFNTDFNESLEFFSSLAKNHEENETNQTNQINHNNTLKKYPNDNINSLLLLPTTPIGMNTPIIDVPISINTQPTYAAPPMQINRPNNLLPPPPKYSCLKNSALPTYRNWCRQTQRVYPTTGLQGPNVGPSVGPSYTSSLTSSSMPSFTSDIPINNKVSEIVQKHAKTQSQSIFNMKNKNRIKYLKRRKIFKRTYHVGRSSNKPQIGVLVSNRTIRNRISSEAQLLKQTPIHDVRKFLIKKGFIKIGTSAPNDVLRKMYESVSLVCGEVQNHNPENLLFNFINDTA